MCSPVAHTLVGLSIYTIATPREDLFKNWKIIFFIIFLTVLPDFDFLIMMVTKNLSDHRTYTHSLLFSVVAGYLFYKIAQAKYPSFRVTFWLSFALIFSHAVVDAFVADGFHPGNVVLFYPLPYLISSPIPIFDPIDWAKSDDWLFSFETAKAIFKEFIITATLLVVVYYMKICRFSLKDRSKNAKH
mgnify:CR=1 FL=1